MAKAVKFDRYGDVDVLSVVDVQRPNPGPGQAVVRVKAAAINPAAPFCFARTTIADTPIASSVRAVSPSDSPLFTLDAVGQTVVSLEMRWDQSAGNLRERCGGRTSTTLS